MALELKHAPAARAASHSVTQAEFDATDAHTVTSGAAGDIVWLSTASQISGGHILQMETNGLTIGLAATAPEPDNNFAHIWQGTAGSVTANAASLLVLENTGTAYMSILAPTVGGILFGDAAANGVGAIKYTHSSNGLSMETAGASSVILTGGATPALAFQGVTTISTASGAMTLDSGAAINIEPEVGSAILLDGTISIDAGVVTGATSITSTAFAGALTGNADTVTTNANLTGHITSTGNAAVLGSFTSAQLNTALTDETGTGSAVFATSPTLVTPALGTPTALVLTSATGLPAAGVVGTASTLSDVQTLTGTKTLNGTSSTLGTVLLNAAETTTITATVPPSTVNFDAATQSVLVYTTNANATWITNLRFSSGTTLNTALATGQSLSVTLMAAQGATAYLGVVFQIDGVTVTPLWQGGLPTAAGASGTDVYTFTVTKTGSAAYRVIASMSSFN
jgi:hypothetical protein